MPSKLEETMAWQIRAAGLPTPEREYRAIPGRSFRCDFAWPAHRVALEVQGGLYRSPRSGRRGPGHTSTGRLLAEYEKHSLHAAHGWRVLPVAEKHIEDGRALRWLQAALAWKPEGAGDSEGRQ